MGCSAVSDPKYTAGSHPSNADIAAIKGWNLTVGTIVSGIGCAPATNPSSYIFCPNGWIYDSVDNNSCRYCTGDEGDRCGDCSASIYGAAIKCRLQNYTGDPTICATMGVDQNGYCDPNNLTRNLSSTSGQLDTIMYNYCTSSSCVNWNSKTCQEWLNARGNAPGSSSGQAAWVQYCAIGDNVVSTACVNYAVTNPGVLDNIAVSYCRNRQSLGDASLDLGFCACQNLPASFRDPTSPISALATAPSCFWKYCSSGSYGAYQTLPQQQKALNCPTLKICNQTINVNAIDNSAATSLLNICSIDSDTDTPSSNPTTTTSSGIFAKAVAYIKTNAGILLPAILLISSVIVLLVAFILPRKNISASISKPSSVNNTSQQSRKESQDGFVSQKVSGKNRLVLHNALQRVRNSGLPGSVVLDPIVYNTESRKDVLEILYLCSARLDDELKLFVTNPNQARISKSEDYPEDIDLYLEEFQLCGLCPSMMAINPRQQIRYYGKLYSSFVCQLARIGDINCTKNDDDTSRIIQNIHDRVQLFASYTPLSARLVRELKSLVNDRAGALQLIDEECRGTAQIVFLDVYNSLVKASMVETQEDKSIDLITI